MMSCEYSCTRVDETLQNTFLPVAYSIIFIVGFLGNVTSIVIYVAKVRPWRSNNIVMLNLAVTDLLYVASLPFLVLHYSRPDVLPLDSALCYALRTAFYFHLYASILFLTCISVFRYVAVVHPLRSARLQERRWGLACGLAVWGIAAAEIHPMLSIITLDLNGTRKCPDFASSKSEKLALYNGLLTILGFLLPLVAVVLCYVRVAQALSTGPYPRTPARARARRMSVAVVVVSALNFTPYHVLRMLRVYTRTSESCMLRESVHAAYILFRPVAALNSCLNLPLYTLAGGRLRQALCSLLPRRNHLLQAENRVTKVAVAVATATTATAKIGDNRAFSWDN